MIQSRRSLLRRCLAGLLSLAFLGGAAVAVAQPVARSPTTAAPALPAAMPLTMAEKGQIVAWLNEAPSHGLPAWPAAALDEQGLVKAAVAQAAALRGRRFDPGAIDHDWALVSGGVDLQAEFDSARAEGRFASWLAASAPSDPGYVALVAARRGYAQAAAAGGWAPLDGGQPLKLDAVDPRVGPLRQRLAAEGFSAPPLADANIFDAPLAAAVKAYQTARGLPGDGVVGAGVIAALNVPAAQRLAVIDANLERLRWAPRNLGEPRIEVDVAAADLTVFQPGAPPLRMRVVVGDPKHHTPLFASKVLAVVFNPPWNVPGSIAAKELWPKEAATPGYLARSGFSVIDGQLRQAPGPKSALGYVKIDIVSPFGVYLHDTPSRGVFSRDRRALSHGCVRVQLPRDLAALLLAPQGWTRQQVEDAIAAGSTRRVAVTAYVPVVLGYRTAVADADGTVRFRPDVYGWDAELTAAAQRQGAAGR